MIKFDKIYKYVQKPQLFEKSTSSLWDDEHISKGMLDAHLNPVIDAASRKHEFIDSSVEWIYKYAELSKGARVLDLGCGPGLYTERLAELGLNVTGIDFSRRSIQYAKAQAQENSSGVEYIYQNYLDMDYKNEYDLAIMIYFDFGVLPDTERDILLNKVFKALKPGGKFIFDVLTPIRFKDMVESSTWSSYDAGYWRPYPHICLESNFIYPEYDIFMRQYVVIDEKENVEVYRTWDHTYSIETIQDVLMNKGFRKISFFADVSGTEYSHDSYTMAIAAVKL